MQRQGWGQGRRCSVQAVPMCGCEAAAGCLTCRWLARSAARSPSSSPPPKSSSGLFVGLVGAQAGAAISHGWEGSRHSACKWPMQVHSLQVGRLGIAVGVRHWWIQTAAQGGSWAERGRQGSGLQEGSRLTVGADVLVLQVAAGSERDGTEDSLCIRG